MVNLCQEWYKKKSNNVWKECMLWSIKEYKKVRLRYYGPEWDEWRDEHLAVAT